MKSKSPIATTDRHSGRGAGFGAMPPVLVDRNPQAAAKAASTIAHNLSLLVNTPEIGRPFSDVPELREFPIPFGASGYVALYRYGPADDAVFVLAFRHQKEAGY